MPASSPISVGMISVKPAATTAQQSQSESIASPSAAAAGMVYIPSD
jgi:hypothetical protein